MPSFDLFTYFQKNLTLEKSWWINGKNYGRTCEHWLQKQDSGKKLWIGNGREAELVTGASTGKDGGKGTEAERREEGKKTFYRYVLVFSGRLAVDSAKLTNRCSQVQNLLPRLRRVLCVARWRGVGCGTLLVPSTRLELETRI